MGNTLSPFLRNEAKWAWGKSLRHPRKLALFRKSRFNESS